MNGYLELKNRHTGEALRLRRVRDNAGRIILAIEGSLPPRMSGPPVHVHFHQREEGCVKAGTLGARVGKEKIVVQAGGTAVFPAGVSHAWWNGGETLLELSGQSVPAVDLDQYLQALFAVLNASASGRPSIFYLAHVLWRHRHTQAVMTPPNTHSASNFSSGAAAGSYVGQVSRHKLARVPTDVHRRSSHRSCDC